MGSWCYIHVPGFVAISQLVPEKKILWRGFTIYGSGSYLGHLGDTMNILLFPLPMEAKYKIWLWLAKWFWRRRCLKLWTDRQRTDRGLIMVIFQVHIVSLHLRWAKKSSCTNAMCMKYFMHQNELSKKFKLLIIQSESKEVSCSTEHEINPAHKCNNVNSCYCHFAISEQD